LQAGLAQGVRVQLRTLPPLLLPRRLRQIEVHVKRNMVLSLVLPMLLSALAVAQNVTGTLEGVLQDPSGSFIPNATCILTNQGTAASLTLKSDTSGVVRFLNILPGSYTLRLEAAGFRPLEITGIEVTANEVRTLGNLHNCGGDPHSARHR
jgi:hypothetical protein